MPVLLIIWRFVKPLLPYIASVLIVVGLLSAYGHREYGRGVSSQTAKTQAEHARAEGFKANQITLTAALNHQNDAVEALKAEGDKRVSDGKTALKAAEKANQTLSDQAAALRKSSTRKIGANDPCVISNTLGNMGGI